MFPATFNRTCFSARKPGTASGVVWVKRNPMLITFGVKRSVLAMSMRFSYDASSIRITRGERVIALPNAPIPATCHSRQEAGRKEILRQHLN